MSYAMSAALQLSLYQHLRSDTALSALVGTAIYDTLPTGTLPQTYVTLGGEEVRDRSDVSGQGAEHRLTVSVLTDSAGFSTAKQVAAAITDAMDDVDLTLGRGRLVALWFDRAVARRRGSSGGRSIELRFRARVEDD